MGMIHSVTFRHKQMPEYICIKNDFRWDIHIRIKEIDMNEFPKINIYIEHIFVTLCHDLIEIRSFLEAFSRHFGNEGGVENIFAKQSFGKSRHKQLLPVTFATESKALEPKAFTGHCKNPLDYRPRREKKA